jgi:hypothetical protein
MGTDGHGLTRIDKDNRGIALNRDRVHSLQLAALVNLAIHRAPKREASVCRETPLLLAAVDFSRGLAPGWQTKGEDFISKEKDRRLSPRSLSAGLLIRCFLESAGIPLEH